MQTISHLTQTLIWHHVVFPLKKIIFDPLKPPIPPTIVLQLLENIKDPLRHHIGSRLHLLHDHITFQMEHHNKPQEKEIE